MVFSCESVRPLQRSKSRKSGKEGQTTPISQRLREGRFESENPHVSTGHHNVETWGFFDSKHPFLAGALGNGSFLTPKPSFPDFQDFDPCRGRTLEWSSLKRAPTTLRLWDTSSLNGPKHSFSPSGSESEDPGHEKRW